MKIFLLIQLILLLAANPSLAAAKNYDIYSYHNAPPFYLPEQATDLSRAWIEAFNQAQSEIKLNLHQIDRPKLNEIIKAGKPYLILWANPLWFNVIDADVLASNEIFWDANLWISKAKTPIAYKQPEDLIGLTLGGREGFHYKDIAKLIADKKIIRIDHSSDYDNYQSLLNDKVDVFILRHSSLLYWQATGIDLENLHVDVTPIDVYTRHILVSKDNRHLLSLINHNIDTIAANNNWKKRLSYWGIKNMMTPLHLDLEELPSLGVKY